MAFSKKSKKSNKRWRGKKFVKKARKVMVNKALQPIPQRFIAKLKYSTSVAVSTVGTPLGTYRFNLNSIWDPDRTGLGHNPYSHDTFQTIYNRYRVIGCHYNISVQNISASIGNDTRTTQLIALPANDTIGALTGGEARETPRCKYILQCINAPTRNLKGYVDIKSLMGRNKSQYMADDRYQAPFGSDPAELAILNVYCGNIADLPENQNYSLNVTLHYVVEMFDIKILPQS